MGACYSSCMHDNRNGFEDNSGLVEAQEEVQRQAVARKPTDILKQGMSLIYPGQVDQVYERSRNAIGEGGFGKVRIAKKKDGGQKFAIKEVRKRVQGARGRNVRGMPMDMILAEASAMNILKHPNLIRLHAMYQDHVNVYMVMDFCDGGDLYDALSKAASFKEKEAAALMQQVLRGVNYMHHSGVCHRDIKPENFLLSQKVSGSNLADVNIKIIDFGCAWMFNDPDEICTRRMGTERYMAPEMMKGSYTHRCDTWSCGIVAYAMLCGHYPFKAPAQCQTEDAAFARPDWKAVTDDAKNLISCLLMRDPSKRASAKQALAHAWIERQAPNANDSPLPSSVVESLRSYSSGGVVKKAALNAMASSCKETDLKKLHDAFVQIDTNQDGTLSMAELKQAVYAADQSGDDPSKNAALRALMEGVDLDGDGRIDYREFVASAMERQQYQKESMCWEVFRKFDLDGNGTISREELKKVLKSNELQGLLAGQSPDAVFEECDKNGDNVIQFEEFYDVIAAS